MKSSCKVAIVAALEREVRPLVNGWRVERHRHEAREFKFFEHGSTVVVCAGIGAEAARRAAEAAIAIYRPALLVSAGFAGALQCTGKVGEVIIPREVIDAGDGSRTDTGMGTGMLVSFASVAGAAQKAKLHCAYGAQAVDMEAAAVARGAAAHGIRFLACKALSDASDASLPELQQFVGPRGEFRMARFAVHIALRPWLWASVRGLAENSARASRKLCAALAEICEMKAESGEPALAAADRVKS